MSTVRINLILEKIGSRDKDLRYMATSDLATELNDPELRFHDSYLERQVSEVIIKQLEDPSGDISGLANKCLGLFINVSRTERLPEIISTLAAGHMQGKKEEQRDVAAIGLKTVVTQLSPDRSEFLVKHATPLLITGLSSTHQDVVASTMDILGELTLRFGSQLTDADSIKSALLPELDQSRAGIRKKAVQCLAALAKSLSESSMSNLVSLTCGKLENGSLKPEAARTYVQLLGALCRETGHVFGVFVPTTLPCLMCTLDGAEETDDELREYCLHVLDCLVTRCDDKETKPFLLDPILHCALRYLTYDPNYADMEEDDEIDEDSNDDDEEMEADREEEGSEEVSEEAYSDDEDTSWKVRRSAARLLTSIISHCHDQLSEVYPRAARVLTSRFKEREETVKTEICAAYIELLKQVSSSKRRVDVDIVARMRKDTAHTVKALSKQLRERGAKTRAAACSVLLELAKAVPQETGTQLPKVIPGIAAALHDKSASSASLKIPALLFLRHAFSGQTDGLHSAACIPSIAPAIFQAAGDRYYKVSAEAIRVTKQLVKVMRPDPLQPVNDPKLLDIVQPLSECVIIRLRAQDQDHEVKEAAIACIAEVVARLGDMLGSGNSQQVTELAEDFAAMPKGGSDRKRAKLACGKPLPTASSATFGPLAEVLKLLMEKVSNDITRLPAIRAFAVIAGSPLNIDLSSIISGLLVELTGCLRKSSRILRQASLITLETMASRHGGSLDLTILQTKTVKEATNLITESDLAVAAVALQFIVSLLKQQPSIAPIVSEITLPACLDLVQSSLLQGAALNALQRFFVGLLETGYASVTFNSLSRELMQAGRTQRMDATKTAQHAAAQCLAVLCIGASQTQIDAVIHELLVQLNSSTYDDTTRRFSLICLGEIGQKTNLAGFPDLTDVLTKSLSDESIAEAASLALGGVASGNMAAYLPLLLSHVMAAANSPKQLYQLLKALGLVITHAAEKGAVCSLDEDGMPQQQQVQVLELLLASTTAGEECHGAISDCLGHLALLNPDLVLPALTTQLRSNLPESRAAAAASLRQALVALQQFQVQHETSSSYIQLTAALPGVIKEFLSKIGDPDRSVRRAAVGILSTAAHNDPALVLDHVQSVIPLLSQQTVKDPSLIRIINLGPFKHEIDDGLELRKVAFECLDVLLDKCYECVDASTVLQNVANGLGDQYDVKIPCHLLLIKLAHIAPNQVLVALDALLEPLAATLTTKTKKDAVKQEIDRHEDLLRSCLRAVDALMRVPNALSVPAFKAFMETVIAGQPEMKERFERVKEERREAEKGQL